MMKRFRVAAQMALGVGLLWFVGKALVNQWDDLSSANLVFQLRWQWIALSLGLTLGTFAIQIQSYRIALNGWHQRLPLRTSAEIWFTANLGRYLPGKVWSVAGMIVMAKSEGVDGWTATSAAVVLQAASLGTAALMVAATLPASVVPAGIKLLLVIAAIPLLILGSPRLITRVGAIFRFLAELRPIPARYLTACVAMSLLAWLTYGGAFWALGKGLGQGDALSIDFAVGIFSLGYTVGLLALFAPGGAVVRESLFIVLLTPQIGAGPALTLALGSRLTLTIVEIAAAVPFAWKRITKGIAASPQSDC